MPCRIDAVISAPCLGVIQMAATEEMPNDWKYAFYLAKFLTVIESFDDFHLDAGTIEYFPIRWQFVKFCVKAGSLVPWPASRFS
jgi:hypothetical protein